MTADNGKRKVRTTIQPDVELEVDDREYSNLEFQGLLLDNSKKKAAAATKTEEAK